MGELLSCNKEERVKEVDELGEEVPANEFDVKLNKKCLTEILWFALPWKYIYLFMFQMMQYPGCTQHCQVDLSFMENHIFPMLPLGDDKNHNWYKSQWGENPLLFFGVVFKCCQSQNLLKNLTVSFFLIDLEFVVDQTLIWQFSTPALQRIVQFLEKALSLLLGWFAWVVLKQARPTFLPFLWSSFWKYLINILFSAEIDAL